MSRVIPYKLSLWKDTTAWYDTTVASPGDLTEGQIIYVIGIPYTTIYKGPVSGTNQYLYEYRVDGEKRQGQTTINNIKVGRQVFEEIEVEELASDQSTFEGRAYNITLTRNINGMNTLSFSIPKTYFDKKEGKIVTNYLPDMIWNKNKIKLKYGEIVEEDLENKTITKKPKWYTFIVQDKVERREDKKIIYDFTCEDFFINELSRTGYSLSFNEENGIGTLDELAQKVLEGTEWEYIPTKEKEFIEKRTSVKLDSNGNVEFNEETGLPVEEEQEIASQRSEYNEVLEKAVYQYYYKDSSGVQHETWEGKEIWGYKTNEVITNDTVRNLVYNGKNYTDSTGWVSAYTGSGDTKEDLMSIVPVTEWDKDDDGNITAAKFTLKLTAIEDNAWAYNDTMKSARTLIEQGEKYALKVTFSGTAPKIVLTSSTSIGSNNEPNSQITNILNITNNNYYVFSPNSSTSSAFLFFGLSSRDQSTTITNVELFQLKAKTGSSEEKEQIKSWEGLVSKSTLEKYALLPLSNESSEADFDTNIYTEEKVQLFYNVNDEEVEYITLPEGSTLVEAMYDHNKKVRTLQEEKSNRYNLLQTLAELFEGWIHFEIEYLDNGKIKRNQNGDQIKKIQFLEVVGKDNWNGFHYGTNLSSITRIVNSEEVVSKIWVETTESKSSDSGVISIQDSQYNMLGETFLYNFNYYITIGEISEQQFMNDMYGTSNDHLGFATKMKKENERYKSANLVYNNLVNTVSKLKAERDGTIYRIQAAKENIDRLARELPKTTDLYKGTYYSLSIPKGDLIGSVDQQKEAKSSIISWATSVDELYAYLQILNRQLGYKYSPNNEIDETIYNSDEESEKHVVSNGYIKQLKDASNDQKEILEEKKDLVNEFEKKYIRYITEGTWQDDNYTDADKYYLDAERVLATSAMPTVSYTIDVLALKALEGYENFDFDVGDKTFVTDPEFFGFDKNNTPIKQEVVISEVSDVLDSQNSSTITVQNFRTQFEDLFSRISATVQTLQMKDQIYSKADNFTPNGEILVSILQNTLLNNSLTLAQAVDQNVIINDRGIEVTDLFNPNKKLRVIADGIYISSDGGINWTTGLTASGMNANFITLGQLDTNKIRIMNGAFPSFTWDKLGITAYQIYTDSEDETLTETGGFVRFDQHGLYIVPDGGDTDKFGYDSNGSPWFASDELMEDYWKNGSVTWFDRLNYIQKNTIVSLTWRGLNIKSSSGSVEIGTDLPAIRIFDNNGGEFSEENYCRVELGYKDTGNGGITQRKDWNVSLREGNETLYGLTIRNSEGQTVLKTSKEGSLWLRENFFIGGTDATERNSKIGIQANGRNTNADGTGFIGENKFIFWSKAYGTFGSILDENFDVMENWYDTFTIDTEGKVTANAITILGDSQFHGTISATDGHFENIMGIGAISRDNIYDSGFSAAPLNEYDYRQVREGDALNAGQTTIYLREKNEEGEDKVDDEGNYIYEEHTLLKIEGKEDAAPDNKKYYYGEGADDYVGFEDIYIRFLVPEDKDYDYAIWVSRLNFSEGDSDKKEAISVKDHPEFYVTHEGKLFASDSIVTGEFNVISGTVSGLLSVGDSIQINGDTSSIVVFNIDEETGQERIFSVNSDAKVEADSIAIGNEATIKDYILLGDNFVLSNPNQEYRQNVVIMAGEYGEDELKNALANREYYYDLANTDDNFYIGKIIWLKEENESGETQWNSYTITRIEGEESTPVDQRDYYYDRNGAETQIAFDEIYIHRYIENEDIFSNAMNEANLIITSRGQISASSLNIVGEESTITGNLKIFNEDNSSAITISAEDGIFTSNKNGQAISGWRINKDGSAEFQNVNVRGTISTSVMKYNEVQVSSGNLLIRPASKILRMFRGVELDSENNELNFIGIALTEASIGLELGAQVMVQVSYMDDKLPSSIIGLVGYISRDYPDFSSTNNSSNTGIDTLSEEQEAENLRTNINYKTVIKLYYDSINDSDQLDSLLKTFDSIENKATTELVKLDGELLIGREIFLLETNTEGTKSYNSYFLTEKNTTEEQTIYKYIDLETKEEKETTFNNIYLNYNQDYSDLVLINLGSVGDGGISLNATASDNFGNALTIDIFQYERENPEDENSSIIKKDKVILGDLSGIADEDFSGILDSTSLLDGFGLYTENAYIKGTITTGNAGLTTDLSNEVVIWAGGKPKVAPNIPKTETTEEGEVRTLTETERIEREMLSLENNIDDLPNFYVKENGFLFAKTGYFSGIIKSNEAEISGTIGTQGLKIKNQNTGVIVVSDTEVENEMAEKVHAAINRSGLQLYSGGDLEIYKEQILNHEDLFLPPTNYFPYIYSDDDLEGLIVHKLMITNIPEENSLNPNLDQGFIFTQNSIIFKEFQNENEESNKKQRVTNLDNNGDTKLRISYNREESTGIRTSGNNLEFAVNERTAMKVYENTVSVTNLDVAGSVSFDEIIMGKAILRRPKIIADDGSIVDKGLDIFVV